MKEGKGKKPAAALLSPKPWEGKSPDLEAGPQLTQSYQIASFLSSKDI